MVLEDQAFKETTSATYGERDPWQTRNEVSNSRYKGTGQRDTAVGMLRRN